MAAWGALDQCEQDPPGGGAAAGRERGGEAAAEIGGQVVGEEDRPGEVPQGELVAVFGLGEGLQLSAQQPAVAQGAGLWPRRGPPRMVTCSGCSSGRRNSAIRASRAGSGRPGRYGATT